MYKISNNCVLLVSMNRRPKVTLPKHNYLGPGNTAKDSGNTNEIHDIDDYISSTHDNAYHNSKTKEDIYQADRSAISDFTTDFIENHNWHSLLGAGGLGVKHLVEKASNKVFYPSITGKYGSN